MVVVTPSNSGDKRKTDALSVAERDSPTPTDSETEFPELRESPNNLQFLYFLEPPVRGVVQSLLEERRFGFGEIIVAEGEPSDALYFIAEGSARVVKLDDAGVEVSLGRFGPGDSFGETGILDGSARSASVRASSPVRAWVLEARVIDALLREYPEFRAALDAQRQVHVLNRFLRTRSVFANLGYEGTARLAAVMSEVPLRSDEVVFTEGQRSDALYVVQAGKLEVHTFEEGHPVTLRYLRTGDMFGETALSRDGTRTASVTAMTDASLLRIGADDLRSLADDLPALAARINELVAARKRLASVPLDFQEELLPVDVAVERPASAVPLDPDFEQVPGLDDVPSKPPARKRRRKRPFVHQLDELDCGAACLGMVARAYGRPVSLTFIRQAAGTGTNGTTLRGLQHGAEAIGITATAYRVSPDNLESLTLPAIVHWEGNHWVVLWEIDADGALIGDPAIGNRRIPRTEFEEKWTGYTTLLTPSSALADAPVSGNGLSWIVPFLRPHTKTLVYSLLLALIAAAGEVAIPILSAAMTDRGILTHDRSTIVLLGSVMLAVALLSALAVYQQRQTLSKAAVSIDVSSMETLTQTLLGVPMSYVESRKPGDIERRLLSMQQVNYALTTQGVGAITSVIQLALILAVMYFFSPVLATFFLVALAAYVGLVRLAFVRIRPIYAALEHAYATFAAKQVDLLKGLQSVKVIGRRPGIAASIRSGLENLALRRRDASDAHGRLVAGITGMGLAITALFVFLGALYVVDGTFTLGQFVAFDLLVGLALVPAQFLASLFDDIEHSSVLLQRLQDVFEQEPEQAGRSGLRAVRTLGGKVDLRNVSMAFDVDMSGRARSDQSYVLRDLTLEVTPGTTVGVVGRSGSGKSTLLRLLSGLVEPTEGCILFDSVDMTGLDYGELRRRIGFVEQAPYLFNSTIAENIALGDPAPDLAQVRRVAEAADAHPFISRLPLAYATPVGDGGLRLSGGQVQRISIARALYFDPDILLLDEATAALDSESERRVKRSLDSALEGRTAFIVAHRLSTVRDSDYIVVLDEGRIVESGDHDELIAIDGLYAYLYAAQVEA